MDVLDFYRCLIDKYTDCESQSSQSHDVDRLDGCPQKYDGRQQGERNVQHDDESAPPIAKKEEHHEAGQESAEQSLGQQATNGICDKGGLIEFEADIHIFGGSFLEVRYGRLYAIDDSQCRCIGTFRNGDVHRSLSVHVRVRCKDVRSILDRTNVAEKDRRSRHWADGSIE